MAGNNKQNVSTTRGVKGGYLFSAPLGTVGAPTKAGYKAEDWLTNGEPPAGWECLGFIPEDGFTESVSRDSGESLRDVNLETVDESDGSVTETISFALMEVKKHTLGTMFGHANVTDEDGVIEVKHAWGDAEEHYQYVFLLLLKNGRAWTKYIPDAKVTELGDLTGNKTTAAQRQVTLTYITDEDGSGCYDWYDSTETPAPQLSTLALTGLTLDPTFDATKHAYETSTTSTSATVTATVASGYTLSIKDGNGNSYDSGDAVPLVAGSNIITLKVTHTDTGAIGLYTVNVTKS